jgi:crotonobetainyl-CoA:carnitine CoA-transferase CaiB-like acyl-CoA transferase
VVPYQVFPTADHPMILAVGNDAQFRRFCACAGMSDCLADARFATNAARVVHREEVCAAVAAALQRRPRAHWLQVLEEAGVPCGPVNRLSQVFGDPHVQARGARVTLPYPAAGSGTVELVANPLKLSATPVSYRIAPPRLDEHRDTVLRDWLGPARKNLTET